MKSPLIIIFVVICLGTIYGYRILGYFPTGSKSHLLIHCAITQALAEIGHNVTVITGMPDVFNNSKYKHIQIGESSIMGNQPVFKDMMDKQESIYKKSIDTLGVLIKMSNDSISHPDMKRFMQEERNSFDLIIVGFFMNDFHYGLSAHFNCPLVVSLMVQPVIPINNLLANPLEVSYVPSIFSGLIQPMAFFARLKNFLLTRLETAIFAYFLDYYQEKLYDEHFPADKYPSFEEVKKNVSLVLTNHHHISQGPIRPNVPAVIDIGGIQIKEKPDALPKDIAEIMDNAKEGVIFLSFGTNVKADMLSEEKVQIMCRVLSQLPYTVIWKWSDPDLPGTSKNIVYKSWLPQDDILAHPNVKLFITHGGQGSVVESQYHGVPMVGIPLFADQPANMEQVVRSGFGLRLDYLKLSEENFKSAIFEVITNPKYKQAVKKFSELYRDRPMSARQTAIYWIEYVLRHRGAKHMQSPAVHLNRFQLMSLDVIGFFLAILTSVVYVVYKLCKMLYICCCGRRKQTVSKTKKNN